MPRLHVARSHRQHSKARHAAPLLVKTKRHGMPCAKGTPESRNRAQHHLMKYRAHGDVPTSTRESPERWRTAGMGDGPLRDVP